jgi:hypothetical protein
MWVYGDSLLDLRAIRNGAAAAQRYHIHNTIGVYSCASSWRTLSPRHTNMNPEMAYFIRPCSLPQNPAFAPCKTRETHRELSPQAFDIARFLGDDQHRGGSENEFSPWSQGAAGNFRGDELGGAAVIDVVSPRSDRLRRLLREPQRRPQ